MELQISRVYSLSVNYVWLSFWSYQVDIWMLIQTTLLFEGIHTVFYTASSHSEIQYIKPNKDFPHFEQYM